MIAALPMYFAPQQAVQAFWNAVLGLLQPRLGMPLPQTLTWPEDYLAHWLQKDLLLSQACGYPLTTLLKGRVQLVGTFAYDVPEAQGILCKSVLICRSTDKRQTLADFAGSRLAFNETGSQSGYNALRALLVKDALPRPFFGSTLCTGAHGASVAAVREGAADMASIDCVSFGLWQLANPDQQSQIRVFGHTERYPGLPLISALDTPPQVVSALQSCLQEVASAPAYRQQRQALLIKGFEVSSLAQYQTCVDMEAAALAQGVSAL